MQLTNDARLMLPPADGDDHGDSYGQLRTASLGQSSRVCTGLILHIFGKILGASQLNSGKLGLMNHSLLTFGGYFPNSHFI